MSLVYWHWFALAMVLLIVELLLPTFLLLWFGLGAAIMGGLLWLLPTIDLSLQLLIWLIASIGFTCVWFLYVKPTMIDKTQAGIAKEALIGQIGTVINEPHAEHERGDLRFTVPVLGNEEWPFFCASSIVVGDRARVTGISGNTLIVIKHN